MQKPKITSLFSTVNRLLLVVTLGLLCTKISAQETQQIPSCNSCLDSLLTTFWSPPQPAKKYIRDTVTRRFNYQSKKDKEVLIFVGNPDFVEIKVNEKTHFGGRYQAKKKLSGSRRFFVPVTFKNGMNTIYLTAHSITDDPFFISHVVLEDADEFMVERAFSENNRLSLVITLVFLTILSILLAYSLLHYLLLYHTTEYKY